MNRWTHAGFALVALSIIIGLAVAWPRPEGLPQGGPTTSGTPIPIPTPTTPTGTPGSPPPATPAPTTPGSTVQPCPVPPPSRLSVLTFNIHGGLGRSGLDLERIAREIEAWDADVVLLQEVDRHRERTSFTDQPTWLATRLGMQVAFGSNVVRPGTGPGRPPQEYGTATLSRLPILEWSNRMLPNRRGLEQRGLLRVTVRLAGQELDLYNTHLQHTRGTIRMVQLRATLRMVRKRDNPAILGGDLNATPDSPALAIAYRKFLDPWPVVGEGSGLTVPPRAPRRRIDYVLHDETFVPTGAQTLQSAVADHRAVRVGFRVRARPRCP